MIRPPQESWRRANGAPLMELWAVGGLPRRRGGPALAIGLLVLMGLSGVGPHAGQARGDTDAGGCIFSIAPTFFDPSETTGLATPFLFLYALHDALIKPMPQGLLTPCLAESWTESPDGLVHDFKLRQGVTFHNGDSLTVADAVFSFQRYKGAGKTVYQEKVATVEAIDARIGSAFSCANPGRIFYSLSVHRPPEPV